MFHGRIFKLSASVAAKEFSPHCKYQVKPHLSPWFSAVYATAIVYRNHFFVCTNRINLLNLNQSSERLVIIVKGFWKLPNLHMPIKQKSLSLPRNLAFRTFGKLLILFPTNINLLYLLYSTAQRCCLLHLIKQNCLLQTFPGILIFVSLLQKR